MRPAIVEADLVHPVDVLGDPLRRDGVEVGREDVEMGKLRGTTVMARPPANQMGPSFDSTTWGTSSRMLAGTFLTNRSGSIQRRSMWLSEDITV